MLKVDDFKGVVVIPDLYGDSPANEATREKFNLYITDYTEYFLRDLLGDDGYDSYALLISTSTDVKWTTLKAMLIKPCCRYIYFNFVKHNTTQSTVGGEVQANFENAVIVTNREKLIEQWNRMSDEVKRAVDYIEAHPTDYPDYNYSDTVMESGLHPLAKISLFQ